MSEKGYRLVQTGKMLYEFEECKPNQVKYYVEFIGHKTKDDAKDYYDFFCHYNVRWWRLDTYLFIGKELGHVR